MNILLSNPFFWFGIALLIGVATFYLIGLIDRGDDTEEPDDIEPPFHVRVTLMPSLGEPIEFEVVSGGWRDSGDFQRFKHPGDKFTEIRNTCIFKVESW